MGSKGGRRVELTSLSRNFGSLNLLEPEIPVQALQGGGRFLLRLHCLEESCMLLVQSEFVFNRVAG